MPKKRRNNGRNKNTKDLQFQSTVKIVKDQFQKIKQLKDFLIKNMVDSSSKRDIEEQSIQGEGYTMPRLFIKNQYCVSCGIHVGIVRVRSTAK